MHGKSIFSWNVPEIHNGDPETFVQALVDGGFEAVVLKAADGTRVHRMSTLGPWPTWGENIRPEMVDAIKAAGLKLYLWHFVYGGYPSSELNVAIQQAKRFRPDAYVWDVEGAFDSKTNAEANARTISRGFKVACPEVRQVLCWWALPRSPSTGVEWHPIRVAKAWLETVDSAAPMMYWQGTGGASAISYLNNSLRIWRGFTDKPITPIGRAYNGDGGYATPEGIKAFANSVYNSKETLNLIGTSWWSLDKAYKNASWWQALKETPKFDNVVLLPQEEINRRLMGSHKRLFPEIYPPEEI